jgi:hypothetical protein
VLLLCVEHDRNNRHKNKQHNVMPACGLADNARVHDCRKKKEWLSAALFPGQGNPNQNISYEVHSSDLKAVLKRLDLAFSKVTHIFRVGGARHLDQYGVDDAVRTACGGLLAHAQALQIVPQPLKYWYECFGVQTLEIISLC